jgi:putative ABC transport system substrate-binding protein
MDDGHSAASVRALLEQDPPSVLVTLGTRATREVGAALPRIPLVAGLVVDPDVVGDHPHAAVLLTDFPLPKQVEWMRRLLPERRTIGAVYSPDANGARIRAARRAFADAGLELLAEPVRSPSELPLALRNLKQRADLIWGLADPIVVSPETAKALLLFSYQNRIPLAGLSSSWVRAGALYALERDYRDLGRQCAELALGVRERHAGRVNQESPRLVRYELNLRAAEHMRVKLDADVRRKASRVFE